jgi:hypothetical protein
MGQVAGFKVSADGGTPQRVFGNYFFQYDHNLIEHPTSAKYFLMIHGKAAARRNVKDIKGHSTRIFNRII